MWVSYRKFFMTARIIAYVVAGALFCAGASLLTGCGMAMVRDGYQAQITDVSCPIEKKFLQNGPWEAECLQTASEDKKIRTFCVWYPAAMAEGRESYPLVIMVNGTGVKASAYRPIFRHLASWGFVVAGNEDDMSGTGYSTAKTLDFILKENEREGSVLYHRIDTARIGVAGHSQGGAGVFNAVSHYGNSWRYKAAVALSPSHRELSKTVLKADYDVSKVSIPLLITATSATSGLLHDADDGKGNRICGIADMREEMEVIHKAHPDVPVVIARIANPKKSHGDNLMESEAYLAAWLCWWLKGDTEAAHAFAGSDAEIKHNPRWRDVESVGAK